MGRARAIVEPDAERGRRASFVYDQDDLRLSKTVGGTTTSYLLDGDEVVRETTAGTPTDLLQGPGHGQPALARRQLAACTTGWTARPLW